MLPTTIKLLTLPLGLGVATLASTPKSFPALAPAAMTPAVADTVRFPITYATTLPTLNPEFWERDYERYSRFMTPEIRKTQMGLAFLDKGVRTWRCQPSANPHAQLDTLTRVTDPAQLLGNWRSVVVRNVIHIDSFSVADQKFYRRATVHTLPGTVRVSVTTEKISLSTDTPKPVQASQKYALINQRYLLLYKAARSGGAVAQVGIDSAGHLLLHNCTVIERRIPGKYLTYQSSIRQSIYLRE